MEKVLNDAGFIVSINGTTPRKGAFVVKINGTISVIELLELKRPFTKLRELDVEEATTEALANA